MSAEEKKHYESLITFFKYTISITGAFVTLIVTVGLYFTYKDTNQMKNDIRSELKDIKEDINKNLTNSREEIKSLNEFAILSLNETKKMAASSLDNIKQEAKNSAIIVSREKVEEAFRENNIQDLIDKTAKNIIEFKINQMVQTQIELSNNKLKEVLNSMPDFMLAVDRFRAGDKKGLLYIDSIRRTSKDTIKRLFAGKIFEEKMKDYFDTYSIYEKEEMLNFLDINSKESDIVIVTKLKNIMSNSNNLTKIYLATVLLAMYSKEGIPVFDLEYNKNLK